MIKVVVTCERIEQLAALLVLTKGLGLTPELGVDPDLPEPKRKSRTVKARASTRKSKKKGAKKYPASMQVRMGKQPEGPPKLIQIHKTLARKFGSDSFRKGDVKKTLVRSRFNGYASHYLTTLMKTGAVVAV